MAQKPIILKQQLVAASQLFKVEQLDLVFNNGERRQYERLAGSDVGAVIVVAMQDDDTVILIREYAAGKHRYELGLPKGRLDQGETPEQGANRELKEEIGFGAKKITWLKSLTLAPAYMGHETQVILAQDLYPEWLEGDEPEPIEQTTARLSDLDDWALNGEVSEGRTIAALYLAKAYMKTQLEKVGD